MYLIFSQIYTCSYTYQLYHISCHIKGQFLSQVYRPTLFHSGCTIFTLYIAQAYEYILRVYILSGSKTFSLHQMHLYVAFKVASGISVCKHCDKVWNQSLPQPQFVQLSVCDHSFIITLTNKLYGLLSFICFEQIWETLFGVLGTLLFDAK